MLVLPGSTAHSDFRLRKLLRGVQQDLPAVTAIHSRFVHLVDCDAPMASEQLEILGQLLAYGDMAEETQGSAQGVYRLVVPRPGTISPWSSKATATTP